ncbi:hypothetical protein Tco_0597507 [Tanacetum coccineum]
MYVEPLIIAPTAWEILEDMLMRTLDPPRLRSTDGRKQQPYYRERRNKHQTKEYFTLVEETSRSKVYTDLFSLSEVVTVKCASRRHLIELNGDGPELMIKRTYLALQVNSTCTDIKSLIHSSGYVISSFAQPFGGSAVNFASNK